MNLMGTFPFRFTISWFVFVLRLVNCEIVQRGGLLYSLSLGKDLWKLINNKIEFDFFSFF